MCTYNIFTFDKSSLVWTCQASSEKEVWEFLEIIKKISIEDLKKLFKIEKNADRTSDNNRFIND